MDNLDQQNPAKDSIDKESAISYILSVIITVIPPRYSTFFALETSRSTEE